MNGAKLFLYAAVAVAAIAFFIGWWGARGTAPDRRAPKPLEVAIGFLTSFLDSLGIGSFAPTTALFKFFHVTADELIPGCLNVGLGAAAFLEAYIFIDAVPVQAALLVTMILSSALGAWLGAGVVSRLPRRAIQVVMGVALCIAGTIFALVNLQLLPGGGVALGLEGWKFGLAVAVNFVLGILMSAGIGLYAPCMIMLALMGVHPRAAFPIMMGSCALVQPLASLRFFKTGRFAWGPSVGLTVGGIFGVLIGVYIVKSLPLEALRWLVIVVVGYAALSMLRSAATSRA